MWYGEPGSQNCQQRRGSEMRSQAPDDVHRGFCQDQGRGGLRLRGTGRENHTDTATLGTRNWPQKPQVGRWHRSKFIQLCLLLVVRLCFTQKQIFFSVLWRLYHYIKDNVQNYRPKSLLFTSSPADKISDLRSPFRKKKLVRLWPQFLS